MRRTSSRLARIAVLLGLAASAPVVAQQAAPPLTDIDADLRGSRIDAVLYQLFDYVGRPLDNLAGGNLGGHLGWQNNDGHSTIITGGKRRYEAM